MNVRWINACKIHGLTIVAAEREIEDHAPRKILGFLSRPLNVALGGPSYGGIEAVVSAVLVEREGCAQENGHFDRLRAGCLLFQSAVGLVFTGFSENGGGWGTAVR